MPSVLAVSLTRRSISALGRPRSFNARPCSYKRSCVDRGRSSGRPWRCRGPWGDIVDNSAADGDGAAGGVLQSASIRRTVVFPQPRGRRGNVRTSPSVDFRRTSLYR